LKYIEKLATRKRIKKGQKIKKKNPFMGFYKPVLFEWSSGLWAETTWAVFQL